MQPSKRGRDEHLRVLPCLLPLPQPLIVCFVRGERPRPTLLHCKTVHAPAHAMLHTSALPSRPAQRSRAVGEIPAQCQGVLGLACAELDVSPRQLCLDRSARFCCLRSSEEVEHMRKQGRPGLRVTWTWFGESWSSGSSLSSGGAPGEFRVSSRHPGQGRAPDCAQYGVPEPFGTAPHRGGTHSPMPVT